MKTHRSTVGAAWRWGGGENLLNYGMFRRKEINGTVKHLMFYDMGAYDTTVSIVGYTVVKTKERGFSETHPQAQILGLGYDRTLGGLELQIKLREHLATKFNELKKPKTGNKLFYFVFFCSL